MNQSTMQYINDMPLHLYWWIGMLIIVAASVYMACFWDRQN